MFRISAVFLLLFASSLVFSASCEYDAQPYLDKTFFASCTGMGANTSCRAITSVQSSGTILGVYPENSSLSISDGGARYGTFADGSLAFGIPLSVGEYVERTQYAFDVSCSDGENSSSFSGLFTPVTPQSPLWLNTWLVYLNENIGAVLYILLGLGLFVSAIYVGLGMRD